MTHREQFEALQAKWRAAETAASDFKFELRYKHGDWWKAPRVKQERAARLQAKADAAMNAVYAWLDANSPRSWHTGVPVVFVRDTLTYEDAMTSGTLSVIPPPVYGSYQSDAVRFASAVVRG